MYLGSRRRCDLHRIHTATSVIRGSARAKLDIRAAIQERQELRKMEIDLPRFRADADYRRHVEARETQRFENEAQRYNEQEEWEQRLR